MVFERSCGVPCRYGLARLHPLLAHAMSLKEANSVTAAVTPLAMHIPFEAMTVRITPLKLQIKGNKIMRGAVRLIEFRCAVGPSKIASGFSLWLDG